MRARGTHVWWAIALSLVAGCNQILGLDPPAADDDGIESPDAREHDAIDLDAAPDRDGDGVLDGDDICPDAADPGQHDEDGDGRGDRCDPCPHLGQTDDVDGDEDGIPDACDPYPAMSAGRLRWNGFHSGAELDEWQVIGGGLEWANDEARLAPVLDGEARMLRREPEDNGKLTDIIAAVSIELPNAGGNARRAVGVVANVEPTLGTDYFLCQIETDLPATDVRLADYRVDTMGAIPIGTASFGSVWPAGDVRLELTISPVDELAMRYGMRCRTSTGNAPIEIGPSEVTELAPGRAGVRTVGVPVRVRWIVVIDHPGGNSTTN